MSVTAERLMKAIDEFIEAKVAEKLRDTSDGDHNGCAYALDTSNAKDELRAALAEFQGSKA